MTSLARRRPGRTLIVVLVLVLTAAMLIAMADPSEARRLPRHRRRQNSASVGGNPPATQSFNCEWRDEAPDEVEFFCQDGGEETRLDDVLTPGENPVPNQMSATPKEFTCTPDDDAPPEPGIEDFGCRYTHAGHLVRFRLDEVAPYEDEEEVPGDPCAEVLGNGQQCASMLPPHDHGVLFTRVVHSPNRQAGDSANRFLNRERLVLRNKGRSAVAMGLAHIIRVTGDLLPTVDRLPRGLTLAAGRRLVIHSGKGRNRAGHLYIGRDSQLWGQNEHVLLASRRGHHLTRCDYASIAGDDDGRRVRCGVAAQPE